MHLLDFLPLWAIYILTILLGLACVEAGFRLGKYWKKQHPEEQESNIGAMIGATLGLWAFLLAFLVGIAINRYDARRELVISEANAIGTTWLRAGTMAEPYRSQSRALLEEYAAERLKLAELKTYDAARARSESIQAELWRIVETLTAKESPNPVMSLYISSVNEVIDLHEMRLSALTVARVPFTLYIAMYVVAMLALLMLGFHSGITGQRDVIVTVVLIVIFSTIMLLIIDLDRSWAGLLRVSQQPIVDLIGSFAGYK